MTGGLRCSGVPLGGLGTGSVEIRTDGFFHEWQVMNNGPWGSGPTISTPTETLHFGMQVRNRSTNRSVVLGLPTEYNPYLNDPYHLPWIEHPTAIDAQAQVPFTTLTYRMKGLPVSVQMEAFSPFIPHDSRNSGLPAAYLVFRITNQSSADTSVALFGALRNLVGYTTQQALSRINVTRATGRCRLEFSRLDLPEDANDGGGMVLGALPSARVRFSHVCHPRNCRDIWEPLRTGLALEDVDLGDITGQLGNVGDSQEARLRQGLPLGVLCQTVNLKARQTVEVGFILAWHFPHFRERDYPARNLKGRILGHRYAEWFVDAAAVYDYAARKHKDLRDRSRAFVDAFYASTNPSWMLDAVAAQFTTLVKSSWWDRAGRFGIWEGLGCCGLQTTDITYYGSFPIVQFFPDIQKSQMRLTRDNVLEPGKIPHMMPGAFSCPDVDHRGRIDLIPQFILLVWRDVLWTGDKDYAREMWPTIVESLEHFETFDADGDGLPNNTGPDQTYDQFPLVGTSAFVGFLYAAALHAAATLADICGHPDMADSLRQRVARAMRTLDEQLWTGQYYRLSYDPVNNTPNDGVMADQVNADWFVRQTTGDPLLNPTRVRSALREVLKHCTTAPGFLANCAWPKGGAVVIGRHTADQANWPWSGVEYALAAHLCLVGMQSRGARVARDVWQRYEAAGLRYNHIECGGHYYRALSSWALYLAQSGFCMDAIQGRLGIAAGAAASFVVCTPTGWGVAETGGRSTQVTLTVKSGKMAMRTLELKGCKTTNLRCRIGGKLVSATVEEVRDGVALHLKRAVTLRAGARLAVGR